ncbi:heterokaryon incompatibility protein-domain-containing protein [Paraphoma chrysanthemicola]|nr:heterokaryon incompatibility protein-domain-containing protein [Paraphoma chrysanthemicola]
MRLINCKTRQLKEYFGSKIPPYAILSHTWGHEEVTFAEFTGDQAAARRKEGYTKIDFTCRQALKDNLKYAWVDTCCIDKTSSAELSEAINSMFAWYASSQICYVYFSDVLKTTLQTSFRRSRWFTRGWTLQELIAPSDVKFFDRDWDYLGTRDDLKEDIIKITSISESALFKAAKLNYQDHRALGLGQYSVAKRMSWAAQRITTRIEDSAYCLLGIFDINMPLLYGEGSRAFIRLQQAIMQKTNDHSIFAWGFQLDSKHHLQQAREAGAMPSEYSLIDSHLLAQSPADFKKCANVERATISTAAFTMTNAGLEIEFPLVPLSNGPSYRGRRDKLSSRSSRQDTRFESA